MRAVDTNILVYARREETPEHRVALKVLRDLVTGSEPWVLPWPCIYEFLRVVTHPRVFHPPTPATPAWEGILALLESPSAVLKDILQKTTVTGNLFHDARIAALLIEHGVDEILTAAEDFRRFPSLKVTNPFQA